MQYCTQKNISDKKIYCDESRITNKYIYYPFNDKRIYEGGLRIDKKYKQSIPNKPLLSIITVVYNRVETIETCILSVLEQEYDNVEYIIIDGASTDGTLDIIKKYENEIDYIISEADTGIYDAMNKGIALASGDAINFMNSDDRFCKNALDEYIQALIDGKMIVTGATRWIPSEGNPYVYENNLEEFIFQCINHQATFVKKDVFDKIGLFDKHQYKLVADVDFLIKALLFYGEESFIQIDKIVVECSPDGATGSVEVDLSNEEFQKLHWKHYGKPLGLPFEIFKGIKTLEFREFGSINESLKKRHAEIRESFDKNNEIHLNPQEKILFRYLLLLWNQHLFLKANDWKFKEDAYKYIIDTLNRDNWYRFGQLSIKEKIIKIIVIFIKLPYLIIKKLCIKK